MSPLAPTTSPNVDWIASWFPALPDTVPGTPRLRIIVLGSQLDPDGMLRQEVLPGAAFQHDDNLWVEASSVRNSG